VRAGVLGGLGLGDLYHARAASPTASSRVSEPSVILFWMSGGTGNIETWAPKPDAGRNCRGPFGATNTN
jgi:hypothetical protein